MRKITSILFVLLMTATAFAGSKDKGNTFAGTFTNGKYSIYIRLDPYKNNITVPGQEIFGEIPGFLGDEMDSRKWLFTSAEVKGRSVTLEITNDYGSEDLVASFTIKNDTTYVLKQLNGSQLKIARNRKWVKIPKALEFIKKK